MSIETRQWVVNHLTFSESFPNAKSDLLNPLLTSTNLIAFIQGLLTVRGGVWQGRLVCTAVRTDHPTYDGPNGHSGGNAWDFAQITNEASLHLIKDVQAVGNRLTSEDVLPDYGVGLGGFYQQYAEECGGYNPSSHLFEDNNSPHLHCQVVTY